MRGKDPKAADAAPRRPRASRPRPPLIGEAGAHEVVHFTVGGLRLAVTRSAVRAIRPSPRLRSVLSGVAAPVGLPLVSFSKVLGIERDTAVDRRILEVVHWGERIGLEVTGIEGIQRVPLGALHPLPELVAAGLSTRALLGVADLPGGLAIVLDLPMLLTERGVGG